MQAPRALRAAPSLAGIVELLSSWKPPIGVRSAIEWRRHRSGRADRTPWVMPGRWESCFAAKSHRPLCLGKLGSRISTRPVLFASADGIASRFITCIPQLHIATAGGSQIPAIRAEGHCDDRFVVSAQHEDFMTDSGVPDLHRVICAGGSKSAAITVEGHAVYRTCMRTQDMLNFSDIHVPDIHRSINGTGSDELAIGAVCQAKPSA